MKNLLLILLLTASINSFSQCLIAHYPLNATTNDTSGNAYHGANMGATPTNDRSLTPNSAYNFDGLTNYINLNNNIPIIVTSEFTLSAWASILGPGGGQNGDITIFEQRDENGTLSAISTIVLTADISGNTAFFLRSSTASTATGVNLTSPTPSSGWHHYVASMGVDDTMRLYIDAIEVAKSIFTQTGDFFTSVDHVNIGSHHYNGATKGLFNGDIDNVKIYNCALTPVEIDSLFTTGVEHLTASKNLVSIYPNPTSGQLSISLEEANTTSVTIRNSLGQILLSDISLSGDQLELDISAYPTGVYFLQVESEGKLITKKIIKQ